MDEDFPELCLMNAKKTYLKTSKKVIRPTPKSNNVEKISKPMEKAFDPGEPLTTKVAVEYLLNGKLKSAVCRYCLKISPALSELDLIMQIAGTGALYKVTIREMIACFYPYKAGQDPNFPEKICQRCLDKAINAYLFTQQCEQSERALLNCFDDMHEKLGKLDPLDRPKKRGRQKLNPNYNVLYAEHEKVMDYAEPIRNIINVQSESLTQEPDWNVFECKKCWQVLPNMESLLNHEKIHPKHMWYHCRLCGKSFLKHNQLKKHHNKVHVLGKEPSSQADKTFKCNECGNVTDNYIQHLEHIEKHKFKTIMEHIIEKKTDKLCLVCLNKRTDLVELDKMICIHGGYPELVGDKTLYTVLASTLPDHKSYKYQELHVPQKANIMTISRKRKRSAKNIQYLPNIAEDMEIQFDLSLPKIVSKDKFRTDDFYYYVFCDPQTENNIFDSEIRTMDTETPRIVELTNKESMDINKDCNLGDKILTDAEEAMEILENSDTGDKIPEVGKEPVDFIENCNPEIKIQTDGENQIDIVQHYKLEDRENEPPFEESKPKMFNFSNPILTEFEEDSGTNINTKLDVGMMPKFNFSYPEYVTETNNHKMRDIKDVLVPKTDIEPVKGQPDMSWVFSKSSEKYNKLKDNEATPNVVDVNVQSKIKKSDCNVCWIFQHLDECENCKNTTKKAFKIKNIPTCEIIKEDINTSMETEINTENYDNINIETEMHTKFVETDTKEHKIDKIWQCNVCLTNNKTDRFTCYCCESNKYIENGNCKVTFGSNKTFHVSTKPKEEFNVDKGADFINTKTVLPVIIEEASMMDFKSVNNQDNIEMQITNFKYINATQSMDIETDSVSYQLDTKVTIKDDDMDIEENPSIPHIVQNFGTLPVNTATNIMPCGTNIQFNIGSTPHGIVQHGKGHRKIKRPTRNIPKAFHK